jgi:hypothetical protein
MSAFNSVSDNVRSVSAGYSRGVELRSGRSGAVRSGLMLAGTFPTLEGKPARFLDKLPGLGSIRLRWRMFLGGKRDQPTRFPTAFRYPELSRSASESFVYKSLMLLVGVSRFAMFLQFRSASE